MHRFLARGIACLAPAVAFAVLVAALPTAGMHKVAIYTNGSTHDIVAAVGALGRSDLTVYAHENPLMTGPWELLVVSMALSGAVLLWLCCGFVEFIERRILSRFPPKR
jgi:RsiW-degrading membrane proteinase PrsW (M82 family)